MSVGSGLQGTPSTVAKAIPGRVTRAITAIVFRGEEHKQRNNRLFIFFPPQGNLCMSTNVNWQEVYHNRMASQALLKWQVNVIEMGFFRLRLLARSNWYGDM